MFFNLALTFYLQAIFLGYPVVNRAFISLLVYFSAYTYINILTDPLQRLRIHRFLW